MAASIEAIFILLGDSDVKHRQDPNSFDKLEGVVISYANKVLGQIINTRQMEVEIPPENKQNLVSMPPAIHLV